MGNASSESSIKVSIFSNYYNCSRSSGGSGGGSGGSSGGGSGGGSGSYTAGTLAIFAAGVTLDDTSSATYNTTIDSISFGNLANTISFGDLNTARSTSSGASNGSNQRAIVSYGNPSASFSNPTSTPDTIIYFTIDNPSAGVTVFGNLGYGTSDKGNIVSDKSNDHGMFLYENHRVVSGDPSNPTYDKTPIEHVTISTPANSVATTFTAFDINTAAINNTAISNGEYGRCVITEGYSNAPTNIIHHLSIPTSANGVLFGNLTTVSTGHIGVSNYTNDTGVIIGGLGDLDAQLDTTESLTISTPGNSILQAVLSDVVYNGAGCSNGVGDQGIYAGGSAYDSYGNNVLFGSYITRDTIWAFNFSALSVDSIVISAHLTNKVAYPASTDNA